MQTVIIVDTTTNEEILRSNDPFTISEVLREHLVNEPTNIVQPFVQAVAVFPKSVPKTQQKRFNLNITTG